MKFILLAISILLSVTAQFLLKKGVEQSQLSFSLESVLQTVFSPLIFLGFSLYGLSAIIWLFVLQRFPLSVAYPAFALSYIAVVIIGALLLKEQLTFGQLIGICLIITGVVALFR